MIRKAAPKTIKPNKSFPIVGIGPSAGDLHSLECFLSALPRKFGFALVFLQHPSPSHKSLLPDLVRSHNPYQDREKLSDGMRAHPGKLYLFPPAKEIELRMIELKKEVNELCNRAGLLPRYSLDFEKEQL